MAGPGHAYRSIPADFFCGYLRSLCFGYPAAAESSAEADDSVAPAHLYCQRHDTSPGDDSVQRNAAPAFAGRYPQGPRTDSRRVCLLLAGWKSRRTGAGIDHDVPGGEVRRPDLGPAAGLLASRGDSNAGSVVPPQTLSSSGVSPALELIPEFQNQVAGAARTPASRRWRLP